MATDGRSPCGVPSVLNVEFEQAFGVTMSTVRKRAAAVQRAEVLCGLNGTPPAVPEAATVAEPHSGYVLLPPPVGEFTDRDEANVLTLLAFRNGPIEDLHAGKPSPLLEDPGLSRITDEEMKTLMIAASDKLAELLALRDSKPDEYAELLAEKWPHVMNWER